MQDNTNVPRAKCGNPNCDNLVPVRSTRPPGNVGYCNRVCMGEARRLRKFKGANASTLGQI